MQKRKKERNNQIEINIAGSKFNIHEKNWLKLDQENFILDYFSVHCEDLLKIDELNAENSFQMYLD